MFNNSPLVSVIIPAYNHEKYVQETVKSIINQTYKNIELIIIDDGSTDNTWHKIQEIKEECEKRFKRVFFETKENEGTCKTLTKLISLTQGEFVYLIASDDRAKPKAIEKEVAFLKKNKKYALVVGNNELIDSEGKKCYWDKEQNNVYDEKEARYKTFVDKLQEAIGFNFTEKQFGTYLTLRKGNYIPNGYLMRKSITDKFMPFTTKAPLEDYYMMMQIAKYAKIKYLDEILFSYRWHDTNTIKNTEKAIKNETKTREYEEEILSNIQKDLKKNKVLPDVLDFLAYGELDFIKTKFKFLKTIYFIRNNKRVKVKRIFNKTFYVKNIN